MRLKCNICAAKITCDRLWIANFSETTRNPRRQRNYQRNYQQKGQRKRGSSPLGSSQLLPHHCTEQKLRERGQFVRRGNAPHDARSEGREVERCIAQHGRAVRGVRGGDDVHDLTRLIPSSRSDRGWRCSSRAGRGRRGCRRVHDSVGPTSGLAPRLGRTDRPARHKRVLAVECCRHTQALQPSRGSLPPSSEPGSRAAPTDRNAQRWPP